MHSHRSEDAFKKAEDAFAIYIFNSETAFFIFILSKILQYRLDSTILSSNYATLQERCYEQQKAMTETTLILACAFSMSFVIQNAALLIE